MILKTLLNLDQVELVEPKEGVQPGEIVVGTLSEPMRALFTIAQRESELIEAKMAEYARLFSDITGDKDNIHNRLSVLKDEIGIHKERLEIFSSIYATEVIEELQAPKGYTLRDVRKGWVVVAVSNIQVKLEEAAEKIERLLGSSAKRSFIEFLHDDCGNPNCPVHGKLPKQSQPQPAEAE